MPRIMHSMPLLAATAALLATSLVASGCSRIRLHNGYIGEQILLDSIEPGVDNRASVQATLGRPTIPSQFNGEAEPATWYYVSRNSRQLAFARPSPTAQDIFVVRFDQAGNVIETDQLGLEQVASIDPYGQETPTLGRNRSFFEEIFGNIGQAGAIGEAGSTADNPGGGR